MKGFADEILRGFSSAISMGWSGGSEFAFTDVPEYIWPIIAIFLICLPSLVVKAYSKTRPYASRRVRLVDKRVSGRGRGARFILTFKDLKTGNRIVKRLPINDEYILNRINLGDEGVLITQGFLYISFTESKTTPSKT